MPQPNPIHLPGEIVEHRYFDNGENLAVVSYSKFLEQHGTGPPTTVTRGDSFKTVDGLLYNPIYATGANPILLAVCETCRHPELGRLVFRSRPTHGLCSLPNARQCHRCGTTTCPLHRKVRNGKALCLRCSRRHRLWMLIKPLFFRRVES